MANSIYLTITGKVCHYTYLYSTMTHKPKCDKCNRRMKRVTHYNAKRSDRATLIGYICEDCDIVIIFNKHTVLRGEII